MEHRSLPVAAFLIAFFVVAGSAWADSGPSPEQTADWNRRLEKAGALQREGKAQGAAADNIHEDRDAACFSQFRVNACRDEARREHGRRSNEARRVVNEGKALEREVKKEQLADKDARHAADAAAQAARLPARATEAAAARAQAVDNEASQRADKELRAAEGAQRRAADAARQQKKRADHEARVAKKMEKAERRAAEQADH